MAEVNFFSQLSDELILKILRDLPRRDYASCAQVNKHFRALTGDHSLHRELHLSENLHLSVYAFQRCISKHASNIETLILPNCYWIQPSVLANSLQNCQSLQEANFIGSNLTVSGLSALLSGNQRLKKLGWSLPNGNIEKDLYASERNLTEVGSSLKDNLGRIESLSLHFQSLHSLLTFITLTSNLELSELSLLFSGNESFFLDGHEFSFKVSCNSRCPSKLVQIPQYSPMFLFNRIQTLQDSLLLYLSNALKKNTITTLHAPGQYNSACWDQVARETSAVSPIASINMDYIFLTPNIISWLGRLNSLSRLSLAHSDVKSNLLRTIAINSPQLQSLNLFCSEDWIDEDLCGLLAVSNHCRSIKELNIGGVHYHTRVGARSLLCKILSTMKTLRSLSVSACSCIANDRNRTEAGPSSVGYDRPSSSSKRGRRITFSITGYHRTVSSEDDTTLPQPEDLNTLTGLQELSQSLENITELEIIDKRCINSRMEVEKHGFDSGVSVSICPFTRKLTDREFQPVSTWKKLTKLTLAGLPSVGAFKSLIEITRNCSQLEFLSLSHIGLPGHSGAFISFPQAIAHCQRLKMLRVNQPHYFINDRLLSALENCKKLEAICIISKEGKASADIPLYFSLFDNCPRLAVFQLFSGESIKKCKAIEKTIMKRYRKDRASLSVIIAPYSQLLNGERLKELPLVHTATLTRFQTRVAVIT